MVEEAATIIAEKGLRQQGTRRSPGVEATRPGLLILKTKRST